MNEISADRLEPMTKVPETNGQQPRRDPGPKSRRRPPSPPAKKPEPAESPENCAHQVDSRA